MKKEVQQTPDARRRNRMPVTGGDSDDADEAGDGNAPAGMIVETLSL